MKKTIITVVGKDTVGIIAKVCTYLAENGINFFFLGAGELFGLFGFAGYRFSGQWPLPPVPFGIAAQGRLNHCWSDRAFPWDG